MENDWEFFDQFEWVSKWFVWLRIFNNFVNMVIWTFWTCMVCYTFWVFFLTKQMNYIGYYVFLYSLSLNVYAVIYLDDYLYFSDRERRDRERRIRIQKIKKEEDRIKTESQREEVVMRAKQIAERLLKYPRLETMMKMDNIDIETILFFLHLAEKSAALDLRIIQLNEEIAVVDADIEKLENDFLKISVDT